MSKKNNNLLKKRQHDADIAREAEVAAALAAKREKRAAKEAERTRQGKAKTAMGKLRSSKHDNEMTDERKVRKSVNSKIQRRIRKRDGAQMKANEQIRLKLLSS